MLEVIAFLMIVAWVVTLYATFSMGYTRGLNRARREFREGLKLVKGGK